MGIWNWNDAVAWRERRQNTSMWVLAVALISIPVIGRLLGVQLLAGAGVTAGRMVREAAALSVQSPTVYIGLWSASALVLAVTAWYREWTHQGLSTVLAGPVGRRHVAGTKWWTGWFVLQGAVLANVLVAVLMGAYDAGWWAVFDWWLSSAIGLSAVYTIGFLFAMWSGTARSATITSAFVVFGIHVWVRILVTALGGVFGDWTWLAGRIRAAVDVAVYLTVSEYLAQGAVFGNTGLKILLLAVAAVGLWLGVWTFERLPLERTGKAWFFRWIETVGLWMAGISLFVIAGSMGAAVFVYLGGGGTGHVPSTPARAGVFLVVGAVFVYLFRTLALWAARHKYAQS
ncbi:hypothetical protein CVV65_03455 [Kyrpidia spormannii]|uniref:Uncharacterized protein n=2 Tax=Kyrpidia spormannii TaxID=2055160 RepID=A0A2K8N3R7_9BACL|nr:hypothetical protein [Kyrpidia spormannii]ATY84121.1 hypothetical protein CVV65_03455 [Kyrpidia spormannii]CAB3390307.1 conserved membrane protein of unknown function [Kyrpidia spormannii]CAB3391235.1 conserved membrane protein of unknown function [Kyrpidia spormannii]